MIKWHEVAWFMHNHFYKFETVARRLGVTTRTLRTLAKKHNLTRYTFKATKTKRNRFTYYAPELNRMIEKERKEHKKKRKSVKK